MIMKPACIAIQAFVNAVDRSRIKIILKTVPIDHPVMSIID